MRWPRARSFDHRTRVRRGRGWRVFSFSVASLWDAGHGFDPILAHPALSPPTPQRLPTTEENRWFSEEVYVHEPSLRSYLRTQYPFAPDIDAVNRPSTAAGKQKNKRGHEAQHGGSLSRLREG